MRDKVGEVLNKLHPNLMLHGGSVELVEVNDGVVKVKPIPLPPAQMPGVRHELHP